MISNKKLLILTFSKEKEKKERGKGQHMDSCIYEPVLLYKLWLHKLIACWYIIIKIIIKKMHIVVIAVQNSQVNKKIGELNFDINNTLQRTNVMLKCCDQCLFYM